MNWEIKAQEIELKMRRLYKLDRLNYLRDELKSAFERGQQQCEILLDVNHKLEQELKELRKPRGAVLLPFNWTEEI